MAETEIIEFLRKMDAKQSGAHAALSGKLEALAAETRQQSVTLAKVDKIVTGGDDPAKGMSVRLDRVEQAEEIRKWWQRGLLGGVLTAIGLALSRLING